MSTPYLEDKVHRLELKVIDLESKLRRSTWDAHMELGAHRSNVWMGTVVAVNVFVITVSVLLALILR